MPASFKVRTVPLDGRNGEFEDVLNPDFSESAIAPVDYGLWWIILLRAYGRITGDYTLQERVDVQTGIDMFPTLLVTDGSCMIDRWMGIHGHPLEIHSTISSYICHLSSNLWEVVNSSEVSQPAAVDANGTLQKWKIKAGKAMFALKTTATPPPRSRLGIQNDMRLQLLESELLSIGQCNMTIAQYFHKVKMICREISE
ncbi:hypothetical protein KY284_001311 [Solanum tuberosum]|nr:hypothetical protein KY284_001311 [Solanum tuberosum]